MNAYVQQNKYDLLAMLSDYLNLSWLPWHVLRNNDEGKLYVLPTTNQQFWLSWYYPMITSIYQTSILLSLSLFLIFQREYAYIDL